MTLGQAPQAALEIVEFWSEAGPDRWWKADPAFDAVIRMRYLKVHEQARAGRLDDWAQTPAGALALVILLDQFSRNLFRGTQDAFACDQEALIVAKSAIRNGFDRQIEKDIRLFFYLPFMHSESLSEQQRCVELLEPIGGDNLRAAREHCDIIRRFGRFPHRNSILGRVSSQAEQQFLDNGGFAG